MKRIIEAVVKEVNFGSEVMCQLTIEDGTKRQYIVFSDCGEAIAFGLSDVDVLEQYVNGKASDFDPQYKEYYSSESGAKKSHYATFFKYAKKISDGFAISIDD